MKDVLNQKWNDPDFVYLKGFEAAANVIAEGYLTIDMIPLFVRRKLKQACESTDIFNHFHWGMADGYLSALGV